MNTSEQSNVVKYIYVGCLKVKKKIFSSYVVGRDVFFIYNHVHFINTPENFKGY